MQATGYGLLVSVLQRNRADFDGFLRFWRLFLTEHGLMYWQLLNHDGVASLRDSPCVCKFMSVTCREVTPLVEGLVGVSASWESENACIVH